MIRPILVVTLFAAIFLAAVGGFWVGQPPSDQELLANTAKALDYAKGWSDVGGPPWWTPNFLGGTSLATSVSFLFSSLWILVWSSPFGILAGPKIASLLCIWIGCLGTFFWARQLLKKDALAALCAAAFLLCPSIYVRLAGYEHFVFVSSFAVLPWFLWSLTLLIVTPSRFHGLLAGGIFGGLLLTYAKAGALLVPLAAAYALVLWLQKKSRISASSLGIAILTAVILGVIPNLPGVREMRMATVFELAPFEGWQHSFSLKSNLLWFDRDTILTQGADGGLAPTTAAGGNYLGLVPGLLLIFLLWLRPKGLYDSVEGSIIRSFLGLFLFAHWLSFGPYSILTGYFEFLRMSYGMADATIALAWALFLIQPWVIYRLLPAALPGRLWICLPVSAVYLVVPGFRLIEWLPLYSDLRAPHDFSQVIGILFLAPAVVCSAYLLLRNLSRAWLSAIIPAAILIAILDISPYLRPFFKSPLAEHTFADFRKAQDFLRSAPISGWVRVVSGRYFYLLTPHFSGRGLDNEAFNSYLMQSGMAYLQGASFIFKDNYAHWADENGVAYLLVDKGDPAYEDFMLSQPAALFPTVYENDSFVIKANSKSLAPAFMARSFVSGSEPPALIARTALDLFKHGAIVLPEDFQSFIPGNRRIGRLTKDAFELNDDLETENPRPFQRIDNAPALQSHYQRIDLPGVNEPGWVVLTTAYHPDWKAYVVNRPLPIAPANGGQLAVFIDRANEPVECRFEPPSWYNAALGLSALGWLGWVALLSVGKSRLPGTENLRRWLNSSLAGKSSTTTSLPIPDRPPIVRPVVIVPTYNESGNLPSTLKILLESDSRLEVLIVDDNSPDGTADLVREHAEFGRRVHLLPRAGKLGLGSAYRDGFQWAFSRNYDACLEMDADLSHDPKDVPRLLAALDEKTDAAIGSRYKGGVRVMNWPQHRLLLSTSASKFVEFVTGMPITDATSGFKAIRTEALRKLDWSDFRTEGYGFQVELHFFLWRSGAVITEVPIVFTERRDGHTKMTLGIAIEAAWRTLQLAFISRTHE